jgi:hypothetical protein
VVDGLVAAIEADRVVAGREDDALHAVAPRRLEDVVAADDVRLQDAFPGAFHRIAAEMHDRIDALGDAQRVGHFRDVGLDEVLRLERPLVGKSQLVFPASSRARCVPTSPVAPVMSTVFMVFFSSVQR